MQKILCYTICIFCFESIGDWEKCKANTKIDANAKIEAKMHKIDILIYAFEFQSYENKSISVQKYSIFSSCHSDFFSLPTQQYVALLSHAQSAAQPD